MRWGSILYGVGVQFVVYEIWQYVVYKVGLQSGLYKVRKAVYCIANVVHDIGFLFCIR